MYIFNKAALDRDFYLGSGTKEEIGHFEPCVLRQKIILNQRLLALSRADSQPWLFHSAGSRTWKRLTHTCPGGTCVRLSSETNCLTSRVGCSLSEVESM